MRRLTAIKRTGKIAACTATLTLFLTGCEREATPEPESPESAAPETPAAEEIEVPTNSILREDMDERPIAAPPLEPLEITVPFGESGSDLGNEAKRVLSEILASKQFKGDGAIVLRGHTDSSGTDEANIRASKMRAEAVAEVLEDAGANPDRITIIGIGEQNPIAPNALPDGTPDEEGRAKNRRVDVTIEPPSDDAGTDDDEDSAQASTAQAPAASAQ